MNRICFPAFRSIRARALLWASCLAALTACGGSGEAPTSAAAAPILSGTCAAQGFTPAALTRFPRAELTVAPLDTHPGVTMHPQRHHVVYRRTDRPLEPELVLFIPGSSTVPRDYDNLLKISAFSGYRTLGLAYANSPKISVVCRQDPADRDCHEKVLNERVYGIDASDWVDVDADNSVVSRLVHALRYLATNDPGQGWDLYLDQDQVRWDRIIVAGHSQGGKSTAFLSSHHEVARAILLSAIGSIWSDPVTNQVEITSWTRAPRATPASRTFALVHAFESSMQWAPAILELYGLGDATVPFASADATDPAPYGCDHRLTTFLGSEPHGAVALDRQQVMRPGTLIPQLADAYLYLFNAPE